MSGKPKDSKEKATDKPINHKSYIPVKMEGTLEGEDLTISADATVIGI